MYMRDDFTIIFRFSYATTTMQARLCLERHTLFDLNVAAGISTERI